MDKIIGVCFQGRKMINISPSASLIWSMTQSRWCPDLWMSTYLISQCPDLMIMIWIRLGLPTIKWMGTWWTLVLFHKFQTSWSRPSSNKRKISKESNNKLTYSSPREKRRRAWKNWWLLVPKKRDNFVRKWCRKWSKFWRVVQIQNSMSFTTNTKLTTNWISNWKSRLIKCD